MNVLWRVAVVVIALLLGANLLFNRNEADKAGVKAAEAKEVAVTACKTAFGEMRSILRASRALAREEGRLTERGAKLTAQRLRRLRPGNCEKAVERELLRLPRARKRETAQPRTRGSPPEARRTLQNGPASSPSPRNRPDRAESRPDRRPPATIQRPERPPERLPPPARVPGSPAPGGPPPSEPRPPDRTREPPSVFDQLCERLPNLPPRLC